MKLLHKAARWIVVHPLELASLFVAALALFTTIYQADLSRKHNRLSVAPIIYFSKSLPNGDLSLINDGMGPGIVESLEVKVEGDYYLDVDIVALQKIVSDVIENKGLAISGVDYSITAGSGFFVVKSNQRLSLIKLNNTEKINEFTELLNEMEFLVCYKSVYNDRFTTKSSGLLPPNKSCNYSGLVKLFGNNYRFHGLLNKPLSPEKLLGVKNPEK